MALSQRDIVITPNRGASTEPTIKFTGADASSSATITLRVLNSSTVGTLSFEGTSGQLFSVTDSMVGTIFSVNDVSGIPSIEVLDTGLVKVAQYSGNLLVGTSVDNSVDKVQVAGITRAYGFSSAQQTLTATTATTNLNFGLYDHFYITLTSNTTFTISNAGNKIGSVGHIVLKQNATGGWLFTKPTEMKTPLGGATISQATTASTMSVLSYYIVDASTLLVNYIGYFV